MVGNELKPQAPGAAFRRHAVEVAGVEVGYWEAGSGPPLVMLPGSAGLDFSVAMDLLALDFRVIALDPPGWGNAPDTGRVNTRRELAEQMAGAVEAIGIERYALVGTSMGGSVALFMALSHPERLSAVVLDGPIEFRGNGHTRPRDPRAWAAGARRHAERRPWADKAFFDDQMRRRTRRFESGYETGPDFDHELAERCKTIELPVLVLYGSDDGVILPSCGREYKNLIVNCEFIVVYDSNHDIQGDRPEAYAELVKDFLQRGTPAFLFSARSTLLNR